MSLPQSNLDKLEIETVDKETEQLPSQSLPSKGLENHLSKDIYICNVEYLFRGGNRYSLVGRGGVLHLFNVPDTML